MTALVLCGNLYAVRGDVRFDIYPANGHGWRVTYHANDGRGARLAPPTQHATLDEAQTAIATWKTAK